jgi:hypothetical protein
MLEAVVMPRAWEDGIAWAMDRPRAGLWLDRRLRAIAQLKAELDSIQEPGTLLAGWISLGCPEAERLADRHAGDWWGINKAMVTQAAYGLRYVELVTGRDVPCAWPFPSWLREWTTL